MQSSDILDIGDIETAGGVTDLESGQTPEMKSESEEIGDGERQVSSEHADHHVCAEIIEVV